ncbi:PTS sugar transporter subunit IIA [Lysinibacillus sp. NPDC047702]|uniref:PTS sugar transporter subunit IIA n=1 Tax=unclassified Lysinibacillus TaxID=2636778 RepID=UPI003D062066
MLIEFLTKETIQLAKFVNTWQEAIRLAADPLLRYNKIEARYIEAMIHSIEEYGPYIVITPKVAIPHARPIDGVKETAISLLTLQEPVWFDTEKPVFIIFVLAAMDSASHLQALVDLTQIIENPEQIDSIIACQQRDAIMEKIQHFLERKQSS